MKTLDSQFQTLAKSHTGFQIFVNALNSASHPERDSEKLLGILAKYIQFNFGFGGGIANLAGEICMRHDLFRDKDDLIPMLADRSTEVASKIFFAAVDEFDDRSCRSTHRKLAIETLNGTIGFLNKPDMYLNTDPGHRFPFLDRVMEGYAANQIVSEESLFTAMGFHAGSEMLADREYIILDKILRSYHTDLYSCLKVTGKYHWIEIHTTVEADHLSHAMDAIDMAIKFYSGNESIETIHSWIETGFKKFAKLQLDFMNTL